MAAKTNMTGAEVPDGQTDTILGFEQGTYPYAKKLDRRTYEAEKRRFRSNC